MHTVGVQHMEPAPEQVVLDLCFICTGNCVSTSES